MGATEAQPRFGHRLPSAYCLPNVGLIARAQKISSRAVLAPFPLQCLLLPRLPCIPGKLFQNTLKMRSALLRYFPFFSVWRPAPVIGSPASGTATAVASNRPAEPGRRVAGVASTPVPGPPGRRPAPAAARHLCLKSGQTGHPRPRPYLSAAALRAAVSLRSVTARHGPDEGNPRPPIFERLRDRGWSGLRAACGVTTSAIGRR